jgi:hypothetical protein
MRYLILSMLVLLPVLSTNAWAGTQKSEPVIVTTTLETVR